MAEEVVSGKPDGADDDAGSVEGLKRGESETDVEVDGGAEETGKKEAKPKLTPEQQHAFDKLRDKEVARRKDAEEKAERAEGELKRLRERVDADDADLVLDAARECGVMPDVLGAGEARGLADLGKARRSVDALEAILEEQSGEAVTVDGKEYTRKQVVEWRREWKAELGKLEKRFGGTEAKARERTMSLFRLGLAAEQAGWKPGKATKPEDGDRKTEDGGRRTEDGDRKSEGGGAPRQMPDGGGARERPAAKGKPAEVDVRQPGGLSQWIRNNRK